ncbi:MAG: fibrobacter succinogenes major paralogous domain-containing protein [Bacteroidales bacterium]|nr:fibrobacter succinogenes major paralogous domain-containing protein [Bacteroidales bacterium]
MSYQTVVRDANNELVVNQTIGIRISILEDNLNGVKVFEETHTATTNAQALATVEIGTGTLLVGTNLADIDWGNHDYYLKSEIDPNGGNSYTITGTQQLLTVPYAFYSGTTGYFDYNNLDNKPVGSNPGDLLYWDGNGWSIVSAGLPGQTLVMGNNNIPSWANVNGTLGNPPVIVTDTVFDITGRTSLVQCHIVDPGSTGVIASGVCWSTNPYPSLGNSYTSDGTSIDTFISKVTGLVSGTTYYVRAYATNSIGTSYGNPIKFTTPEHCGTVTDWDGNTYQTIYIGAQCWMKENLKTTHYSNGAAMTKMIPSSGNGASTYPISSNKFYYDYNNDTLITADRGLLYSWWAVMNGAGSSNNNPSGIQGICPSGWHVPSNAEWCELENYVEPGIDVNCGTYSYRGSMAKKLSAPQYWSSYQSNSFAPGYWHYDISGFNTSGFSAIPCGRLNTYYSGSAGSCTAQYEDLNNYAYFWSCTTNSTSYNPVNYRILSHSSSGVCLNSSYTTYGTVYNYYAMSVRCVKN